MFIFRLIELVNARMGNPNIYNGLPVMVEQNSTEITKLGIKMRERLRQKFQSNPYLRNEEVALYLNGLLSLATQVEPQKFVVEVTKE